MEGGDGLISRFPWKLGWRLSSCVHGEEFLELTLYLFPNFITVHFVFSRLGGNSLHYLFEDVGETSMDSFVWLSVEGFHPLDSHIWLLGGGRRISSFPIVGNCEKYLEVPSSISEIWFMGDKYKKELVVAHLKVGWRVRVQILVSLIPSFSDKCSYNLYECRTLEFGYYIMSTYYSLCTMDSQMDTTMFFFLRIWIRLDYWIIVWM